MLLTNRARILYDSPLSRPRNARFIVLFLSVIVVISAIANILNIFSAGIAALPILFISLAAALLLTIVPLTILWFLDRREPEPKWLCLIAVLWGAFIATGLALPLNSWIDGGVDNLVNQAPLLLTIFGSDATNILAAPLVAPLVEETTKGLGVLLLFWLLRSEFDGVRDGFIYGALVGVGFNLFEAPFYVVQRFITTGDIPLYLQMGGRFALFGLGGHALYSGLIGMGLGLARQTTRRRLRYAAPVAGWLLAFMAHFLWNSIPLIVSLLYYVSTGESYFSEIPSPLPESVPTLFIKSFLICSAMEAVVLFPFLLIVGVMLKRSGLWELQVIRSGLVDETEPVITPEEYEAVKRDRLLATRRISGMKRRDWAAIVKAQNKLAIRKWRVKHDGQDVGNDPLVICWREDLARLRERVKTVVLQKI